VSICSGFGLVTNVIANFILIPPMGIAGAAVASLISYSAIAALLVVIVSRFSRRSVLSLLVPRREELRLLIGGASRGLARARQIAARRGRRQAG
jgi:O-antigen/teichoic acid export membrane protein